MALKQRIPLPVPIGQDSSFMPALQCDRTLVVFVHGFRGKAVSTWLSFPDLVDNFDGLRSADLLFYGFASRALRMQNIAINLRSDIDALWKDPISLGPLVKDIFSRRPRPNEGALDFAWDRIIFVAHSLGAVVVRRALLDCFLNNVDRYGEEHWTHHSGLCLYAPAHSGANILRLLDETLSTLKIPIGPFIKFLYPCIQDLKEGCRALKDLKSDYLDLADNRRILVNAMSVFLAENDFVVDPARFPGDPAPDQIAGTGHIDVCKPNEKNLDPISKLSQVLVACSRFNQVIFPKS